MSTLSTVTETGPSVDGYNVSKAVFLFHSFPHLQLTRSGLIELQNSTFDYGRPAYVNSLLVNLLIPLVILLLMLLVYILFVLFNRYNQFILDKLYRSSSSSSPRIESKPDRGQRCYVALVLLGVGSLVMFFGGLVVITSSLQNTDSILSDFIHRANQSKSSIRHLNYSINEWSQQMANRNSSIPGMSTIYRNAARFTESNVNYIFSKLLNQSGSNGSSSSNLLWFQWHFRLHLILVVFLCSLVCLAVGLFWFWFVLKLVLVQFDPKHRPYTFHFIIINISILLFVTIVFGLALTGTIGASDFCISAKPVIADIVLYKNPKNHFHPNFVNYYLYCGTPNGKRWWTGLDQPVLDFLARLDKVSLFDFKLNRLVDVKNLRTRLSDTYQVVACSELNRLLNNGLTTFCTGTIDGLTVLTLASLVNLLVLLVGLFVFTYVSLNS